MILFENFRKSTQIIALLLLGFMLFLSPEACFAEQPNYRITITAPSDPNGPVSPGGSFLIAGTIDGNISLPEGVSLRVSVLNDQGDEVRFAEAKRKDWNVIDRFCDAFFYYDDDIDPKRLSINAREFPCLVVDDADAPEKSLRNANIKCWVSDSEFNSFIPYATDQAHGLLLDDGIGYTDAQGNFYDALPNGEYTAEVILKDSEGHELASARKLFAIAPPKDSILCRYHPDEQYHRMMKLAAEKNWSMGIDHLPGLRRDPRGRYDSLKAMFICSDLTKYSTAHVHMVEYLAGPETFSMLIEIPYIEKYRNVDDPEVFSVYIYDIGEPSIEVNGQTIAGKIIPVDNTDKLHLCRADLTSGTEGFIDFAAAGILSTDTDFSDGVTLRSSGDYRLAIAGLVTPYQLEDDEIVFDYLNDNTGLLNRIENIIYIVWDGLNTKHYTKPVTLTRKFKDGSVYDSVMEFYHVFSRDEINPDGEYSVALYAIDKNGKKVDGTFDSFVINRAPSRKLEGFISTENINKFGNVSLSISEDTFRAAGFEEGDIVTAHIGDKVIDVPFVTDYTDVRRGDPLLVCAKGRLALWVSMGSFAEIYNIARRSQSDAGVIWRFSDGTENPKPVTLSMKQKAGYLEGYRLRNELAALRPIMYRMP